MTIFINYAHNDKAFIDELVIQISRRHTDSCIVAWEFAEGDSLIEEVKSADDGTSAALIILSTESVLSEWCQHRLSAELKQLEDKHAVIIPVVIDDCCIPEFAKDMPIADFSKDVDAGMCTIMKEMAKVGIYESSNGVMSLNWLDVYGKLVVLLGYDDVYPSGAMQAHLEIRANSVASAMYYRDARLKDVHGRVRVFEALHAHCGKMTDAKSFVSKHAEYNHRVTVNGSTLGEEYSVLVNARLLGDAPECEIQLDVPGLIFAVYCQMCAAFGIQSIELGQK
jgi:hypothetical protein